MVGSRKAVERQVQMDTKNVNVIDRPAEQQSDASEVNGDSPAEQDTARSKAPQTGKPSITGKRAAGIVVLIVLAIVAIALITRSRAKSTADSEATTRTAAPPIPQDPNSVTIDDGQLQNIKLEAAGTETFTVEKIATGRIGYDEDVVTPVFSPYTGRIVRLLVRPGEMVKAGALLAEVDTPDVVQAEQDLISQISGSAKAKTALELTRRNEQRQRTLYANKAAALAVWEQAQSDLKNAENDLQSAEAGLAASRSRLKLFGKDDAEIDSVERDRKIDRLARVVAPLAGTVTGRKVGPGQFVKPDNPDPLFTIANLSSMWMLADVYETDVPMIKMGQPVEVRVMAYPNEIFKARISYINPTVDPATHRVAIRAVVDNRGLKLKPDMFANFKIITGAQVAQLAVPQRAVVRDGDKACVWVAEQGNRFVRRPITLGIEQNGYVQVVSGIAAGERIVCEGSLFLSNLAQS
jgi:cobalt-zinc-cadmium efflux system membrane fusion protein